MLVYVVVKCYDYEGEEIEKVFSSEEKAEKHIASDLKYSTYGYKYYTYNIRTFEIDGP